eukprot:6201718-Pleurochrysis_carterae.AAC.3
MTCCGIRSALAACTVLGVLSTTRHASMHTSRNLGFLHQKKVKEGIIANGPNGSGVSNAADPERQCLHQHVVSTAEISMCKVKYRGIISRACIELSKVSNSFIATASGNTSSLASLASPTEQQRLLASRASISISVMQMSSYAKYDQSTAERTDYESMHCRLLHVCGLVPFGVAARQNGS